MGWAGYNSVYIVPRVSGVEGMAANTKVYRVKFETEGFKQVAESLQQVQKGIRNTTAEALTIRKSASTRLQPRNNLGQFESRQPVSSALLAKSLDRELKRLNNSLDRISRPMGEMAGNMGKFIDTVRPKSREEVLDRQFEQDISPITSDSKGLARSIRTALREQNLELVKAIESSGGSKGGFNPLDIVAKAGGGLLEAILLPVNATIFGAFEGLGAQLTRDFSRGLTRQTQKSMGLSFDEVGQDIGEIIGNYAYGMVDELSAMARNITIDRGANSMIHVDKALGKLFSDLDRAVSLQIPRVGARAYRRMRINKEAVPLAKGMGGRAIIEQPIPQYERDQIEKSRSITLAVGGYNEDKDDFGKDYVKQVLTPLMGESAVIGVKRQDLSKGVDPVVQRILNSLVQDALKSPETRKQVVSGMGALLANLGGTEKEKLFGNKDIGAADDETILSLFNRLMVEQEDLPIGKVVESALRGYGMDDLVVAAQAMRYRQEYPDKPINVVGFSQGGYQAAGATEILKRMGVKGVKGVAVGTPFTGTEYSGDSEDFMSFMGEDDFYYKGTKGAVDAVGAPEYAVTAPGEGSMHSFPMYATGKEFKARLQQFLGNRVKVASDEAYPLGDAAALYNMSADGALNAMLRTVLSVAGADGVDGLDMTGYKFASTDLESGNDPFSGKPRFVSTIEKGARKARNPQVKDTLEKYLALIRRLKTELERKEMAMAMGQEYRPDGLLEQASDIFPELSTVKKPAPAGSAGDLDRTRQESPLLAAFVTKMQQERKNFERTFLAMLGAKLPKNDKGQPEYAFFDKQAYEQRANDLSGFTDWVKGEDWWGKATDAEKEALAPYIAFMEEMKKQVLQVGKTGILDTAVFQQAKDLLGVSLPQETEAMLSRNKSLDVTKSSVLETFAQRKKGAVAESNPELIAYIEMLNREISKYNEGRPVSEQRPLLDPKKAKHVGSGMFGVAFEQPLAGNKSTVYKAGKWNNDRITETMESLLGPELFAALNPFPTYKEQWGKDSFQLVDPDELESMRLAGAAGVGPELRSSGDRFLEMERVEGQTVARKIESGTPEQVKAMLVEVGKIIRKLHEAGVTHGDMSPWNMMVSDAGEMKAIDFGSAQPNAKPVRKQKDIDRMIKFSQRQIDRYHGGSGIDARDLIESGYGQEQARKDAEASQREQRRTALLNLRKQRAEARQQYKNAQELQRQAQENAKKMEPSQLAAQQASKPQAFAEEAELPQLIEAYQVSLANAVKESGKAMLDSLESTMEMLAQSAVDGGEDVASEFALQVNQSFYTYADKVKRAYVKALAAMRGVSANAGKGVGRGSFKQVLEQLRTDFDAILGELQTEMVVQVRDIIGSMDLLLENYEQNYAPPMLAGATNRPDVERFDQLVQDQVMAFQESLEKLLIEIVRARTGSVADLQGDRARLGLPAQAAPQQKAPIGQRYQEYLTGKLQAAKQSAAEQVRAIFPNFKQLNLGRRDEVLKAMKSRIRTDMEQFRVLMANNDRQSARQLGEGLIQRIEAIKEAYDQIGKQFGNTKKVGGHKSEMTKFSNELKRNLVGIAENATGTFADEIEGSLGGVGDAGESMGDTFLEEIRRAFGIQSPSKKMQEVGENVVAGLEQGLDGIGGVAADAAAEVQSELNQIRDPKNIKEAADDFLADGIKGIREFAEDILENIPVLDNFTTGLAKIGGTAAIVFAGFGVLSSALNAIGFDRLFSAFVNLPQASLAAAQEMESLSLAFQSVYLDSDRAAVAMDYVADTANRLGLNLRSAQEAYLGLVATTRGTELEGFQTDQIFEAFAQTAAIRGLDQQQQQQMFTAVQQVLGKGKLSAEEVRGQLGEIPALAFQQTLADALGVNLQQLDKMLSQGQLGSEALFKVAQTYAAANSQLSGSSDTATAAISRFENAAFNLQAAFGKNFLGAQNTSLKVFAGVLNAVSSSMDGLIRVVSSLAGVALARFVAKLVPVAATLATIKTGFISLFDVIKRSWPLLVKFVAQMILVNAAIEAFSILQEELGLTDADKQVAALSARYQELAGSIGAAAKAQEGFSFRGMVRSGIFGILDGVARTPELLGGAGVGAGLVGSASRLFGLGGSGRLPSERLDSLQANRSVARSIEQTSVANLAISEQSAGIKAAEKLLQIEQDMVDVRSYRISLTANDGAELERTKKQLEDLRKEADRYQESVSQARSNADAALQASKAVVEQLRSRYADSLTEEEKQELQAQIDAQLKNINLLEQGQQELDLATSRVSRNLSAIATLVSRVGQRVAAFQENLANAFNEYRTQLIETGLNLGLGEQTIRLQIEQADIQELQDRIATLRREAQDLERKAEHPDIAPQVKNIRDRAEREGTQIGIEFLQAIISENLEDTEAAQLMLQTLEVQGQIRQDEYQLMQQMLQSRQSIRDSNRSIFDFLRQLDQEFADLQLQLQEQLLDLKNAFRRSQLQRLLVPGSTGLFGDVVQGIQGLLDQAAEVATRYLGQERRRLEISQRRYDLSTRLEDFRNSLGGATDALNGFTAALTGRTAAGAGTQPVAVPSSGGETFLGITGASGIGSGAHLDIRKRSGDRPLTQEELNRFNVNGRSLTSYPVTSGFGPRNTGIPGASTYHRGIDFGINTGGKITTTVPVRSVSLRDPSQTGGGGWVTDVVFEDGLEVSLLHLDPSTQGAGVGRRSAGSPSGISSTGASVSAGSPSGISSTGATFSAGRRMTIGQLVGIAQAAGFNEEDARIMAAIAMGESSGDPMAHNPTNMDNSYGLWQINMLGAMGPERRQQFGLSSNEQLFDPATNARAAKAIFDSQGWGAWGAYTNGSYRQYLSQAQSAPTAPTTNRDAVQAQRTADAIMQTSERLASVDSSQTTVAVINLLVGAKNAVEELRRSLRTGRRDMLNSSRGIVNSLEQYLNPDTLTQAIQQNENTFIDFGNQVEVERERIQDTATQLHLLMDPTTGLPAMIQQLRASGDEADKVVANSLEEQLNLVRDTSQIIDLNLRVFDIKATERRIEEARQREERYITEKNRLETENAQIAIDLENAQSRNNIEGERGLAIAQERNNLQLRLLELNREFSDRPDILSERIESETRKTEIAIRTLEFQAQQKALSERQYQNDISNQLLEAQATQAEGPRGDNGLFGFRAQGLREEAALLQEQLRYEQQILELRQRYQDPVFAGLLTQLEGQVAAIRDINIQNIDNQFKDLGETIEEVGTNSLSSFFDELFTGTQTIGQALRGLVSSVLKSLAQIAAQNVARSIVGRIAGAIGGAIGGGGQAAFTSPAGWSGWKYGGTIPAYAEGGRVVPDGVSNTLREILPGMNSSFMREGSGAVLGVFTPGEEVLSLKTGEAQRYQALKRALGPNPLHSVMAGNFAFGGTVGINPDILTGNVGRSSPYLPVSSVTQLGSSRGGFGGQNVTVNYQVNTPDANSFRKSQFQINRDATLEAQRLLARR